MEQAILWRAELRGQTFVQLWDRDVVSPTLGSHFIARGGTVTLLPPPPVPQNQRLNGARVRQRSAQIVILAARGTQFAGPIAWGLSASRIVEAKAPDDTTIEVLTGVAGPPEGEEEVFDLVVFTWFEGYGIWWGQWFAGIAENQEIFEETPEETENEDDDPPVEGDENAEYDDGINDPGEEETDRPPGDDDPDDTFTDPETGEERRRSQGRLIMFQRSTNVYFLSGDGGRTWQKFESPFSGTSAGAVSATLDALAASGNNDLYVGPLGVNFENNVPTGPINQIVASRSEWVAVGPSGKVLIDREVVPAGPHLSNKNINRLAYRGSNVFEGGSGFIVADEKRGSPQVRRNNTIQLVQESFYRCRLWVAIAQQTPNPIMLNSNGQTSGTWSQVDMSQSRFGDNNPALWWSPDQMQLFFSQSYSWSTGTLAMTAATELANRINNGTAIFRIRNLPFGPWGRAAADLVATPVLVNLGGGSFRAAVDLRWDARAPGTGDFNRWVRPEHPQANLFINDSFLTGGAFAQQSIPPYYKLILGGLSTSPNSDSFQQISLAANNFSEEEIRNLLNVSGPLNGSIRVLVEEDTRGEYDDGFLQDPAVSLSSISVYLTFTHGTETIAFKGTITANDAPVASRPVFDGRINGPLSIVLDFDPLASSVIFNAPPTNAWSITAAFPNGWAVPIDTQIIGADQSRHEGWLNQTSISQVGVPVQVILPIRGAYLLAAAGGEAALLDPSDESIAAVSDLPDPAAQIAGGGGRFVAWAAPNKIWTSVDGVTWEAKPDLPALPTSIAWGGGSVFVAITESGQIIRTTDAFASATLSTPPALQGNSPWLSINFAAGRFWAGIDDKNLLAWSNDGILWKALPPISEAKFREVEGRS
jgi:hypothetical protein